MKTRDIEVDYIDHMGSDLAVVNAARVSFDKESKTLSDKDEKLIKYLAAHGHWTPFAHAILKVRVHVPIFVARQLHKHTVGLVINEVSRRYVDDEPEFYMPDVWRGRPVNAKQGSSDDEIVYLIGKVPSMVGEPYKVGERTTTLVNFALSLYREMIDSGVAPEQARMILPQNMFTSWIWTGSLYAFARIAKLRLDSHAQKETQDFATKLSTIASKLFPVSWQVLVTNNL